MIRLLIILLIFTMIAFAGCSDDNPVNNNNNNNNDPFDIVFDVNVGGSGWEIGEDVVPIPSGGYIVTGWTDSYGQGRNDLYLIRVDADGDIVWERNFGGTEANSDDHGDGVTLTADGNILVVGYTNSFGNGEETYVVKVDMDGNLIWENQVGTIAHDSHSKVVAVTDGYMIGGNSWSNEHYFFARKIDLNGNLIWDSVYTITGYFLDMEATDDGGFVLTGDAVIKINQSGIIQWSDTTFGETEAPFDVVAHSVIGATDGSILASGYRTHNRLLYEDTLYVVKYSSTGNILWNKKFQFKGRGYILENNDGTFSVAYNNYVNQEIYIAKLDNAGDIISHLGTGLLGNIWDFRLGNVGYVLTGSAIPEGSDEGTVLIAEIVEN